MTVNVLFAARPERWSIYQKPLQDALNTSGINANLSMQIPPAEVDYIVYAPNSDLQDFTPYIRAKAVLNLWAGVENITGNPTLKIPLARMVDPGLTQGMVEWVTGHVLRYHLGLDNDILNTENKWLPRTSPLASERNVTVLGLGELGRTVAGALAQLGFNATGWSRSVRNVPNVTCLHADSGLSKALENADIVVLLLPDTAGTQNTLNAKTMALMPQGAFVINPGRGPLIDDDALLAALDSGQIAHATLDVFRIEPLPADHPFWTHPNITVTPHIAAATRPETSAGVIAENIKRAETGLPLLHLVDRELGY